jgi:pimeloyl-ACP methyl ester carboxylesterase
MPPTAEVPRSGSSTIVLVHGAWHGAWCWDLVVEKLRSVGASVIPIDLPGHGDDPGPLGDLHADSARLTEVLDELDSPVLLVGHSYGGAVITEAGVHASVHRLVYLCALAIDGLETCSTAIVDDAEKLDLSFDDMPDLSAGLSVSDDGVITLEPSIAAAALYNGCGVELTEWAMSKLGPQRMESMQQGPTAVAWREKPAIYVVCSADKIVHPGLQRVMAKRCTESLEWDSGHSPFLSMPDRVVDLLLQLARP